MATLTNKMYLTPFKYGNCQDVTWLLSSSQYKHGEHGALHASYERTVTVDLPDDWNPVAAEVESLRIQKATALADYQRTVAQLNERLSKLLAITCEATA